MEMNDILNVNKIRETLGFCGMIDAKRAYYFCDKDVELACIYLQDQWLGIGYNPPWTNEQIKEQARKKLRRMSND